MNYKIITVGLVLAGTALAVPALTLGRARGAAWIGQPLELLVPVQLDGAQADGTLCAEADVFHGDSRQESSRVLVQVLPTDQPGNFNLKITSSSIVDEPVVTVYLRAGCAPKFSRKYVLLADIASDTSAPASRVPAPVAPAVPLVTPADTAVPSAAAAIAAPMAAPAATEGERIKRSSRAAKPTAPMRETAAQPTAAPDAASKQETAPKPEAAPKASKVAEASRPLAAGKPRLRLDPVEILGERVTQLESASTASTVQKDAAQESQKMEALQSDLKVLLDQAAKNEASLLAMRERLERSESERVSLGVVYGLAALVLLCLGALAYLWSRRPQALDWKAPAAPLASPETLPPVVDTLVASTEATQALTRPGPATESASPVDVDLFELDEQSQETVMALPQDVTEGAGPDASRGAQYLNFTAPELAELRLQAEFFAKKGKVDEAIEVLEYGLHRAPQACPLLFLDLLDITHAYSRKIDFREFREQFSRVFNVAVPEFPLYRDQGRALEAYTLLSQEIQAQWESPEVLGLIEGALIRGRQAGQPPQLDQGAFKELVHLHGVARAHHRLRS